jgi:hypothetical protein
MGRAAWKARVAGSGAPTASRCASDSLAKLNARLDHRVTSIQSESQRSRGTLPFGDTLSDQGGPPSKEVPGQDDGPISGMNVSCTVPPTS